MKLRLLKLLHHPTHLFTALLLSSIVIFLAHYAITNNAIWGDARYYYAYVRSWVIDQDIDFSNERLVDPFYFDNIPTPINRVGNKYSIGTPIMWLPGFLFAHFISWLTYLTGLPLKPDGYGHLYRLFIGLDSVVYMVAGLYLSYRGAALFLKSKPAIIATLTLALGSHLFYYLAIDPANSHPPSVFIASLITFLLLKSIKIQNLRTKTVIILGLLTGLLAMIRNHDIIFALPAIAIIFNLSHSIKTKLQQLPLYLIATLIGFTPQLISWLLLYGTITSPYFLMGEGFNLFNLQLLPVLFSPQNGLFFFSPILILAFVSLWQLKKQQPIITHLGLTLLLLQTLILASWSGWWGGAAFGARMFLSLTPFFVLGLAHFFSRLKSSIIYPLSLICIILTQLSVFRFLLLH